MKISVNWLRQFTAIDLSVDDLVAKIGAQLGAVEEVIDLGTQYKGIVAVKVISCVDHPNADRLHVCMVDDGGVVSDVARDEHGYVQVVCGAPNVREGITVAWLPPASTVPASYGKDPFVLEARALRGVMSNGMLASSKELAIGDDHSGILEIDIDAAPGTPFAEIYQLNDHIIDIENKMFTHRPDCFGILGVAREIAGIQHLAFTSPDWYQEALDRIKPGKYRLALTVQNDIPELVPRFMAVAMSGVTVRPSPVTIQTYLSRVGIRPINNIVDITNYLMVLTGQPLHAYDYDKLAKLDDADSATIVVRNPHASEQITLLNGKTIEPRAEAAMIASATKLIGVGGVMGGAETEVDDTTKNIILEAANFDMYSIRRTAMAHGLFTDAVTRFNKGQSPLQNDRVLEEAVSMVESLSGAHVASDVVDDDHSSHDERVVHVGVDFINVRLGLQLTAPDVKALLENVEFRVSEHDDTVSIMVPFWRTDIAIPEDVVEEVGRLYGYDQLPLDLPLRSLTPAERNTVLELKTQTRTLLSRAGANEVLTYSFVHGNLLNKVGQDKTKAFQLSNALSPDLQYYRQSLTPSLLDKVHANIKAGYDEFALFELGKTHNTSDWDGEVPAESERIALVYANGQKAEQLKDKGAAYYQALMQLTNLLNSLEVEFYVRPYTSFGEDDALTAWGAPYEATHAAMVMVKTLQDHENTLIGVVGEFTAAVTKAFKLPDYAAGFELDLHVLAAIRAEQKQQSYIALPRFPKVEQDICLKVPITTTYGTVWDFVTGYVGEHKPAQTLARFAPVDIYQRKDDTDHKQITLRVSIASYERTLTDEEVARLLDGVAAAAADQLSAERI